MFGLPGDPTARRGAPTQFDEDYSYEEESYAYPVREVEAVDMGDESEYATAHGRGSAGHQGASFAEPSSEYGFEDSMDQHDHAHEHGQTHAHSLSHAQHTEAGDTTYPESDASSYVDPDEDPHAWETRLDELAGLEEMNEREARSLRWGPSIYPGLMQARE